MPMPAETARLVEQFASAFGGRRPRWLVRVPGRINLIGEHTDYNGFPAMPMALDRTIRLAVAPREDGLIELKDADNVLYPDRQFELEPALPPFAGGDWGNYVKAAVQSLVGLALEEGRTIEGLKGMSCLVDGDIPAAAGLSSSTALVVASALAFCGVNAMAVGRRSLAERMAEAEHYVGTQGGGMDQAACLLAREGEVLKTDFFPLRTVRLPFPADHCIVAADSMVRARKTREQRLDYNRRVLECNIGAQLLARQMGVPPVKRLAELAPHVEEASTELPDVLLRAFDGRETLSLRRAAGLFETDAGRFARQFLRMKDGRLMPMPGDGLKVFQRCRHVFTEAERTEQAAECLRRGDMERLGRLMDESHRSCARDYEISCYELDHLVDLMRKAGALGARLTGAGFGGFAIGLVRRDRQQQVCDALEREFYAKRGPVGAGHLLVVQPAAGALEEPLS